MCGVFFHQRAWLQGTWDIFGNRVTAYEKTGLHAEIRDAWPPARGPPEAAHFGGHDRSAKQTRTSLAEERGEGKSQMAGV